jgi:hypothetical protein
MRARTVLTVVALLISGAAHGETVAEFERRKAAALQATLDSIAARDAQTRKAGEAHQAAIAKMIAERQAARAVQAKRQADYEEARERARLAQAESRKQALSAAGAEQERLLAEPRWSGPLLSALLCSAQHERDATSREIAKEKRLAREVGVVNLRLMGDYQDTLRDDDERIRSARQQLAQIKVKPMICSNQLVNRIEMCRDDGECDEESQRYVLLLASPEDFLDANPPQN